MKKLADDLFIDEDTLLVYQDGHLIHLSLIELKLLNFLTRHAGERFTKNDLLRSLWNVGNTVKPGSISVNIMRLRKKLNAENTERYIETVYGKGFSFKPIRTDEI